MTERNPPSWTQGGSHPAEHDRLLTESLVQAEGVITAGALAVSERAAGANMSVDVAAGHGWVDGDQAAHQGIYHVYNDAVVNLAIAASDATNPRVDLVIARVYDQFYAGSVDQFALEVVTGTPASSPTEPAVPDNSLVLARVDVAAGATSITDANITDRRQRTYPRGGGHVDTVIFKASGTFDKADYPWLRGVRIICTGGGGGGGGAGATGAGQVAVGGGGGGGATTITGVIDVSALAASETVTIGAGGAGGSPGNDGANGSQSSFGTHATAAGGTGAVGTGARVRSNAQGGRGGTSGTGLVGIWGGGGGGGFGDTDRAISGAGGSSHMGGGGEARNAHAPGINGQGYGGGGSGACVGESHTTGGAGGDGSSGVVIVELYA